MVKINDVNTKRFISYGQMLQIFYLEVIKDSDDPVSHKIRRFLLCFHPNHPVPSRDGKVMRFGTQPQGQDGLSTFEFKDNVNGLNLCTIYTDDTF